MVELKVVCNCGQKYKFDIEPVGGQMPFAVNCPSCGIDGTHLANACSARSCHRPVWPRVYLTHRRVRRTDYRRQCLRQCRRFPCARSNRVADQSSAAGSPPATVTALRGRSQSSRRRSPHWVPPPRCRAVPKYMQDNPAIQNNSFLLGTLGALGGAVVAAGLMTAFVMFTGFKFPLMGTVMGAIIGFGARLGYKGTVHDLGSDGGSSCPHRHSANTTLVVPESSGLC